MTDNEIYNFLVPFIAANVVGFGVPELNVRQAFQPTQQGTPSAPTAFIFKIADHRYGMPLKADIWDEDAGEMVHTMKQKYESLFQLSCTSPQGTSDPNALTASDVANSVSMLMQSDFAINSLYAAGLQILRITDVRNPSFENEKSRHEFMPAFDFTLMHDRIYQSTNPVIDSVEYEIYRV